MRFIQEFGYNVKLGQEEAHQKWVIKNDAALRAAAPAGSRYLGTFSVVYSTEKQAGAYKFLVELDSYAAMDAGAAAAKDPKSPWGRLLREVRAVHRLRPGRPVEQRPMKDVVDATIWDPK